MTYDCVIVGGGPAGLTAATYLGRFRRRTILFDAGESRLQLIPLSRNVPGFPEGISGPHLLDRMRAQADPYGVERREGRVTSLSHSPSGFAVATDTGDVEARTVLLSTGVEIIDPDIGNLGEAVARGLVRYCPICDGYEAQDKRIAVLGGRPGSVEEARFLTTYSRQVAYIPARSDAGLPDDLGALSRQNGVEVLDSPLRSASIHGDVLRVALNSGEEREFDVLYPCLGAQPRSDLLTGVVGAVAGDGGILVDTHGRTTVAGIYAAGDVLKGLDQIASACGQAAIAATAIHNQLRRGPHR